MTYKGKPVITSHEPTVFVEGQPALIAGRFADENNPVLISREPTVLIAGHPAATFDGQVADESRSASGKPTVLLAGRPAADV